MSSQLLTESIHPPSPPHTHKQVSHNGQRHAPPALYAHTAAATALPRYHDELLPHEGAVVVVGGFGSRAEEDDGGPCSWWERAPAVCVEDGERRVYWLDVGDRLWNVSRLRYA